MSDTALKAKLAALEKENAELKEKVSDTGVIRFKVGDKGGLSMYGLGRFPVTLYREQWERLLASTDQIQEALQKHRGELKQKS